MTSTEARGEDEFGEYVGRSGSPVRARHAVNEAMIAHWCDAMGDGNPSYTDPDFAAASVHGGIVAPPAMLDVWDRAGLSFVRGSGSPRTGVMERLFSQGFDSIVAVNTELEFPRYLRCGELISNVEVLDAVSPRKRTARGPGHFLTTRHRFTNQHGEHVGDLMFRILLFRPEPREPEAREPATPAAPADSSTGATAAQGAGSAPDPDPALRPQPALNDDNRFFWEGAQRHELRIQRCLGCGRLLMPPGPRCPHCGSFEMGWAVASGGGRLYSFAVPEHPRVAGFSYPLTVGLVELDEGVRVVANLVGLDPHTDVSIGMHLELCWLDGGMLPLPQFRAPKPTRALTTLQLQDLSVGDAVPLCSLPITTTLVVAGAIATRDYTPVHHDRAVAEREGSKDVFLNINTSVGLLQRVVSDWAGPEAIFRSIRVRLGAPGFPGDLLTFSGRVTAVDAEHGTTTVGMRAGDSLGDHAVATVELSLPTGGRS
ncbi:MAG: MaoC family dehydratase N-terminal domain-containing protein [Acidimicrobiales bacterium]